MSIVGEAISLRQELYKMKLSREEGITPYFMRISEIRYQLQELGEVMSDNEMTTIVLNAYQKNGETSLQVYTGRKKPHHSMIYGPYVK